MSVFRNPCQSMLGSKSVAENVSIGSIVSFAVAGCIAGFVAGLGVPSIVEIES